MGILCILGALVRALRAWGGLVGVPMGPKFVVWIPGDSAETWGLGRVGGCSCFEASGPYFVVWAPW